ncbi:MAG: trans-sulfuration enzyme family protein [Thermoplasmata archaeon]
MTEIAGPGRARVPFRPLPEWAGTATRLVHGGDRPERNAGSIVPPIYASSIFRFPAEFSQSAPHGAEYLYSRYENPTVEAAAEVVRDLEGAETARLFSSGMGAISATMLSFLRAGDEVVAPESLYGGTLGLLRELLPLWGIRVRLLSDAEAALPEEHLRPGTKLVFLESPTNPTLRIYDLARWAEAADRVGALSVVDSTFATPIVQRPLDLGFDLVVHSATKALGGHSDLTAGAVAGAAPLLERIRPTHLVLGSALDPFAAFLLLRGMRTLSLRVERQSRSAARLVEELARHPKVLRIYYPGRSDPGQEELARRQMRTRGGVLAFEPVGGARAARELMRRFALIAPAASLGGVESVVSLPAETSHVALTAAERERRGIGDGLLRLSVGIEETEDLVRDVLGALDALSETPGPAGIIGRLPSGASAPQ